jgi:hypothetical protein
MLKNNLIIFNPKQLVLNPNIHSDKIEVKKRENNSYYNKIINLNIIEVVKKY